jgi:4-amino-4-deoxy-L-arabinose transferase-like glycosyltransferase
LLAGLALAQWGIITLLIDGPSAGRILAAGLGIGLALLAKGPMGLLVPGATLAVAAITCRDLRPRAGGWVALGAAFALGCACFLAWAIPANLATDGAFLREGLGDHVVQRGMEARESHGGRFWISLPYYLPILLVALLACLPGAVIGLIALVRGRILGHAGRWLLVGWTVPAFLAISIFATKLPHYLLPAVPALAILAAAGVMMAERDGIGAAWRWALRIQVAILVLLAVGLGLALPVTAILGGMGLVPNLPPLAGVIAGGLAAAAALLVGVAALWSVRRRPLTSQLVASLAIAGWLVAVATVALPEIEPLKPAPRLAAFIQRTVPAGTPIATCGYDEPSLYAYLGPARGPIRNLASASDLVAWAAEPGPGVAVVLASRLTEAEAAGDLGLTELQRETGVNYSKNHRPIVVVVLERGRR